MCDKPLYIEEYHDNCHDYLIPFYIDKYADSRYIDFLNIIKTNITKLNICRNTNINSYKKTIVCDQHCVVISNSSDKYSILATYALNACMGLILYNKKNKVGAIAHIDGLVGFSNKSAKRDGYNLKYSPIHKNINLILKKMRYLCQSTDMLQIDYYIIGGIFGISEILIHDIVYCFNDLDVSSYSFRFKGRNILGPKNQTRNICFDTKTGKISYFSYLENYDYYSKSVIMNPDWIPPNIIRSKNKLISMLDISYIANLSN